MRNPCFSDDLKGYLERNEVVYDKTKMNGKYQVGSGRIVTVTHDTPFIEDIVPQSTSKVNTKLSLSLSGYVPTATKEELEAELNRVKWDFKWNEEKLRDNLMTVRQYIADKHPTTAAQVEIDNEDKRIIVTGVDRVVDFEHIDEADKNLAELLRSIGIREDQIPAHLSAFTTPVKSKQCLTPLRKKRKTPP